MSQPRSNMSQKIVVTSHGDVSSAQIYERFGRTYWLMTYDPEIDFWQAIDNQMNRNCMRGAGIATAREVMRSGAKVVLTGETGPKAFRTLNEAGIQVVQNVFGSVFDVVRAWLRGELLPATAANDPGSPGCLMERSLLGGGVRHKTVFKPAGRTEMDGG